VVSVAESEMQSCDLNYVFVSMMQMGSENTPSDFHDFFAQRWNKSIAIVNAELYSI
jgi:hypothetical protein